MCGVGFWVVGVCVVGGGCCSWWCGCWMLTARKDHVSDVLLLLYLLDVLEDLVELCGLCVWVCVCGGYECL
jgi:hypothetical protein